MTLEEILKAKFPSLELAMNALMTYTDQFHQGRHTIDNTVIWFVEGKEMRAHVDYFTIHEKGETRTEYFVHMLPPEAVKPVEIFIHIDGGMVRAVYTTLPARVHIYDADIEKTEEPENVEFTSRYKFKRAVRECGAKEIMDI